MLEEARTLGFLGPGPVGPHAEHARGFAAAAAIPPRRACDLGSGGGLPGLVLALRWPSSSWVLLDANRRRCAFLVRAVASLNLTGRVDVLCARAEEAGRAPGVRASFGLVVARAFGPPAAAAECAAPLLRVGGRAVVSEPPGGAPDRWPPEGLSLVGMAPERTVVTATGTFQVLVQVEQCPDRFPRRVGMPAKRPLF